MYNPYTQNLGHWIKRYHLLASQQVNDILKPYGLARSQWNVLFYVQQSDGLSQKKLQGLLHIESASLTGIVDSLIRKGWLERTTDQHDRRIKILTFTTAGKERWRTVPDPISIVNSHTLKNIPEDDIMIARQVLERAVRNLENTN